MFHGKINKRIIIHIAVIIFWLAVWQAASTFMGLDYILAGPVKVLFCLMGMFSRRRTYIILAYSFLRILAGFLIAFMTAFAAGAVTFRYPLFRDFINPVVTAMKALPVAAFIILVLMITGSSWLSSVIAFIVTFPIMYYGILEGLGNLNKNLNDMAYVYEIDTAKKLKFIVLPQCVPYVNAAIRTSAGMCWKAGAAAEIIGLPQFSIGEQMYLSKLYLESDVLLSWGIIIIAASVAFEKAFLFIFQKLVFRISQFNNKPYKDKDLMVTDLANVSVSRNNDSKCGVNIQNVSKSYDGETVLDNISLNINCGMRICLMGKSGIGKTTLIKIILGLESSDGGGVSSLGKFSAVFQESSLCPWMSAADNVCIAMKKGMYTYNEVREMLKKLLDDEAIDRPASALSGGMKRRCEIVRAIMSDSSIVVLDEPFAGLDENTKALAVNFILDNINGRALLVSTHDINDVKALAATAFVIDKNDNDC